MREEGVEHLISSVAQCDEAELHPVVRAYDPGIAQRRCGAGDSGGFSEISTGQFAHDDFLLVMVMMRGKPPGLPESY